jgi:hypothetical protein
VHLLVGLGPAKVAILVRDVAVERRDRGVDQLGQSNSPRERNTGTRDWYADRNSSH